MMLYEGRLEYEPPRNRLLCEECGQECSDTRCRQDMDDRWLCDSCAQKEEGGNDHLLRGAR